jgi:hypothetical protein
VKGKRASWRVFLFTPFSFFTSEFLGDSALPSNPKVVVAYFWGLVAKWQQFSYTGIFLWLSSGCFEQRRLALFAPYAFFSTVE